MKVLNIKFRKTKKVYPFLIDDFKKYGKEFLDDDFPTDEIDNFIETLWKRISIFISYGVFYPIEIETYKNIGQ